ncbi:MAG TPA: hypothetical protein VFZ81_08275 [Burkholderiales bacterium]
MARYRFSGCKNRATAARKEGPILRDNHDMLKFVRALGFEVAAMPEEPTLLRVARKL